MLESYTYLEFIIGQFHDFAPFLKTIHNIGIVILVLKNSNLWRVILAELQLLHALGGQ